MTSLDPATPGEQRAARPRPRRFRRVAGIAFRATRNILALMMVGIFALVFTPLTDAIHDRLNVATHDLPKADAILCLGGGAGRELRAAVLWFNKVAPVIIVSNRPGAAESMRMLVEDAGVPRKHILVDNTSGTTFDHPKGIARLPGVDPEKQTFVIVTDYEHTRRARDCFVKAGYKHVVCWSGFKGTPGKDYWKHCEWRIYTIPTLIYEAAAMVQYTLQGRI